MFSKCRLGCDDTRDHMLWCRTLRYNITYSFCLGESGWPWEYEYIRYNCAAISWCNSALELVKKHDWSDPLAKYRHAKKIRLLCEIASFHEKEDQKENWIVALRIAEVVLGTARSSWYE